MNLTMLAKAFWDGILPQARKGEIYYSVDNKNEVEFIYLKNEDYYKSLLESFSKKMSSFLNSNASTEWINLLNVLSVYEDVIEIDFGYLEHYDIAVPQYSEGKINHDIINSFNNRLGDWNSSKSLYKDVKRLYEGYKVGWRGSQTFIVIEIDFNLEKALKFDLKPLISLLEKYNISLNKLEVHKIPTNNTVEIRISIDYK